jgi:hypothetical protein
MLVENTAINNKGFYVKIGQLGPRSPPFDVPR